MKVYVITESIGGVQPPCFIIEADSIHHAMCRINDINIGLRICGTQPMLQISNISLKPTRKVTYKELS